MGASSSTEMERLVWENTRALQLVALEQRAHATAVRAQTRTIYRLAKAVEEHDGLTVHIESTLRAEVSEGHGSDSEEEECAHRDC